MTWRIIAVLKFAVLLLAFAGRLSAQEATTLIQSNPPADMRINEITSQLRNLDAARAQILLELSSINQDLNSGSLEINLKELKERQSKLSEQLQFINNSFEEVATGGAKLADYNKVEVAKSFDWKAEVLEIFKPMLSELKALTEKPRAIEALRGEKNQIEVHLPLAIESTRKLQELQNSTLEPQLNQRISGLLADWRNRQQLLESRLKFLDFKLNELINPPDKREKSLGEKFKYFILGRGLTVFMAVGTFLGIFVLFAILTRSMERRFSTNSDQQQPLYFRALRLGFQLAAVIVSLMGTMFVLYLRDDWLILSIIVLILIGLAWGLSRSLPRYLTIIKLLLNMGSAREGERLIYQGIPYKVQNINLFSTLINPLLEGGELKLPVAIMESLCTRPSGANEPWFPSRALDYVQLDDGVVGQVVVQSPEFVKIRLQGDSHKYYPTPAFLSQNPRNLSCGFGVSQVLGIDYQFIKNSTRDIPQKINSLIRDAIAHSKYKDGLLSLDVEFKQAAASSLDFDVIAKFTGDLASEFYALNRFLQKCSVEAVLNLKLSIPFPCMTLYSSSNQPLQP